MASDRGNGFHRLKQRKDAVGIVHANTRQEIVD